MIMDKRPLKHSIEELKSKVVEKLREAGLPEEFELDIESESFIFPDCPTSRIGVEVIDYYFDTGHFENVTYPLRPGWKWGRQSITVCGPGVPRPRYLTTHEEIG